jgi:hypothetical protein
MRPGSPGKETYDITRGKGHELGKEPASSVPDGIDAAPANGAAADEKWAICCSGGGIRSASYCLAAMQSRQQSDLLARAKWIPAYALGFLKGAAFALTPATRRQTVRLLSGFFSRSFGGSRVPVAWHTHRETAGPY